MTSSTASRAVTVVLLAVAPLCGSANGQTAAETLAPVDQRIALAEASLRTGEPQIAESRYRAALFEAWMLAGALQIAEGRLPEARDAFRQATHATANPHAAFRALALVQMQMGKSAEAVALLTRLTTRAPNDVALRRLLAQALVADGQHAEAVQTLEEAHAQAPDDAEVMFLLGAGYLRLEKLGAARQLFADVAATRPIPQTWVLIGRTYRDFRQFGDARAALGQALKQDPTVRRAHYYLGTIAAMSEGEGSSEEAIREFAAELKLAPGDPMVNLRLGMTLADARREAEALPHLERAAKVAPSAIAYHHLGRCLLALGRPAEAVPSLRRSLDLAVGDEVSRVRRIHYQLALALRQTGNEVEAAAHFDAAKAGSERRASEERETLAQYLDDSTDATPAAAARLALESPLAGVNAAERRVIAGSIDATLARAYFNLGVMRAQAQAFGAASEFFAQAADRAPDFPQVQYSLGAARFNAKQYAAATEPLARALASDPENANVRRMLALAHFNSGGYRQAADLLGTDTGRQTEASLQYTYGLALVRSDRAREAEAVFRQMLADHGDRAEVHVILGQAHAQQGNFEAAVQALDRARALAPDVSDANATLGFIHLKQGRLAEAAIALREELRNSPQHIQARHLLATVLELDGQSAEALTLVRAVLSVQPGFSDARYLLGKILLTGGQAEQAVPHLEAAVALSPGDASYHYQLAQAYRRIGRVELAERHLALFQSLKDKARGKRP